jgi:tRNA modification GTPase
MAAGRFAADTIFALSTAPGRSAIAAIRISGPRSGDCLAALGVSVPPARIAARRELKDLDATIIDDAIVLWFPAPHSFTGQDVAELHVHGSRAIIARLVSLLSGMAGLRTAEPGEFTRRAIQSGKMDLIGAEALGDLIDSDTEQQRRQAIRALGGGLQDRAERMRKGLIDCAAIMAAAIDFSDEEDVPADILADIRTRLIAVKQMVDALLRAAAGAEIIRDGVRVVLAGPPNAGKSSLFNALVGRDAAIVTSIPGTTRDRLEATIDLGGFAVRLLDTAGVREALDEVEAIGVQRSWEAVKEADLVLWLRPIDGPSVDVPAVEMHRLVTVGSKADLGEAPGCDVSVSVQSEKGLEALRLHLVQRVKELALGDQGESGLVIRSRQRSALERAQGALMRAIALDDFYPELIAEEIRIAQLAVDSLTGRVGVEDVLDAVFSRFCIGK